jgi:hypothetical protein
MAGTLLINAGSGLAVYGCAEGSLSMFAKSFLKTPVLVTTSLIVASILTAITQA